MATRFGFIERVAEAMATRFGFLERVAETMATHFGFLQRATKAMATRFGFLERFIGSLMRRLGMFEWVGRGTVDHSRKLKGHGGRQGGGRRRRRRPTPCVRSRPCRRGKVWGMLRRRMTLAKKIQRPTPLEGPF